MNTLPTSDRLETGKLSDESNQVFDRWAWPNARLVLKINKRLDLDQTRPDDLPVFLNLFPDAPRTRSTKRARNATNLEDSMKQHDDSEPCCSKQRVPHDWARLLAKLRWIGLEEEAKQLEYAVSALPPEHRCGVSTGPFNTD